jgi:hypothetical protein
MSVGRPRPSRIVSPRGASAAARALGNPTGVRVRVGKEGVPREIDGHPIELVRESWLVEDRWWTGRPLRRRYWEVVSVRGRNLVVFHDLAIGGGAPLTAGWFAQVG